MTKHQLKQPNFPHSYPASKHSAIERDAYRRDHSSLTPRFSERFKNWFKFPRIEK